MTKRLQVLLDESELREMQRMARAERMTLAEWVRQALRQARRQTPSGRTEDKLDAIRRAVQHEFPTADIDQMNASLRNRSGRSLCDRGEPQRGRGPRNKS